MGAADCIMAVMSYVQQYNTHNIHIKTQPHKHICIPIYKHTINIRKPKANIYSSHQRIALILFYSFELNVRLAWAGSRVRVSGVLGSAFGYIYGANELSGESDLWGAAKSRNS